MPRAGEERSDAHVRAVCSVCAAAYWAGSVSGRAVPQFSVSALCGLFCGHCTACVFWDSAFAAHSDRLAGPQPAWPGHDCGMLPYGNLPCGGPRLADCLSGGRCRTAGVENALDGRAACVGADRAHHDLGVFPRGAAAYHHLPPYNKEKTARRKAADPPNQ